MQDQQTEIRVLRTKRELGSENVEELEEEPTSTTAEEIAMVIKNLKKKGKHPNRRESQMQLSNTYHRKQ